MNHKTSFKHVDGKIILVTEQLVWGDWIVLFEKDVTDELMKSEVFDDYLDHQLGLKDPSYKHFNAKIKYTGEENK